MQGSSSASQPLLLAPTPWQQSLKGIVAPMGAVPSTPSPTGPHRLLSATLGSSQAPALVPSVWDWHTAGLCHASWGRDPQAPQVAVQSSNARGMVPPGRVTSTPWLAVGGGACSLGWRGAKWEWVQGQAVGMQHTGTLFGWGGRKSGRWI